MEPNKYACLLALGGAKCLMSSLLCLLLLWNLSLDLFGSGIFFGKFNGIWVKGTVLVLFLLLKCLNFFFEG